MTITVDFPSSRIRVSSDQAALDVGALYAAIKDAQDSETGVMYSPIAAGAGRFDLGGGRTSGLVVRLNAPWQIEFLGAGQRTIDGGILVGGAGGQPVAVTLGTQVVLNRPADAFGVSTSGTPAPSALEVASAVWSHSSATDLLSKVEIAQIILRNKTITNPTTGTMTVFADDGVTPLLVANLYEDVGATQPYRGQGAEHRGRFE